MSQNLKSPAFTKAQASSFEYRPDNARMLPAMPLELVFNSRRVRIAVESLDANATFHVKYGDEKKVEDSYAWLDAYALRDGFLRVKTEVEAVSFLLGAGGFRIDEEEYEEELSWSAFKLWQTIIRSMLIGPPLPDDILDPWNGNQETYINYLTDDDKARDLANALGQGKTIYPAPFDFSIGPDGEDRGLVARRPLTAAIEAKCVLDAILATAYVDGLREIQHRLCALYDCSNLFEVTTKHQREYCPQPCAHKSSVRKQRAAAKLLKTSVKVKTATRKHKRAKV